MITITKKIFSFATLTLLVAITLSSIAAWYSVLGLVAIFAAAVVPVTIMGGSLEFAKVVTTLWLHKYWKRASWAMKLYLVPAVISLAFLTSMGIFGFLSKSHSDQSLVSGDVAAKIAVYDQKIEIAKSNIDSNRKALQQMDAQVDQLLNRTVDDKGANRAVTVRKQQRAERDRLNQEIQENQVLITKINEEAAPIRAEVRKIEAEVGPIKYIAAMIYGDNPDTNLLERAVRWVIILIIVVFDPLALALVLAAQNSYRWLEEDYTKELIKEAANVNFTNKNNITLDDNLEKLLPENEDVDSKEEITAPAPGGIEAVEKLETPNLSSELTPTNVEIVTDGITLDQTEDGEYVQFNGKSTSKNALLGLRPDLFKANPDNVMSVNTGFGTTFPQFAHKGNMFVRVDVLPNKVYKFDGQNWIEINKLLSDSYLYDQQYIEYLANKIYSGEYDVELLSDNERIQLESYLETQTNKQ